MSSLLSLQSIIKTYGIKKALNGVNLEIESGKIVGLLGPNGSGKTTMIKIITGMLKPTAGLVTIGGNIPGMLTKSYVAYLPDKDYLDENMKIKDIVELFSDFYKDFSVKTAYDLMQDLNISVDSKIKTLSKGNREKLQLILIMSRNARLYVLDEPIAGVDPAARDYILRTIIGNYNKEATVLISTHLISDVENILDEAIFIREGEIILHDTVENIRNQRQCSVDEYFREVFAC